MSEPSRLRYAKQSRIRVRSGIRLVVLLLAVAAAGALLGVWWLAKLGGSTAGLFAFVTLVEYLNAKRLERSA